MLMLLSSPGPDVEQGEREEAWMWHETNVAAQRCVLVHYADLYSHEVRAAFRLGRLA